MTLGERLKKARKNKKLTLTEVENIVGATQSYLSKLERGERQNPSLDLLYDLANLYEVDFRCFVDDIIAEKRELSPRKQKSTRDQISALLNQMNEDELQKLLVIIEAIYKNDN